MKRITVIGIGRLGGALAIALSRAGFSINELVCRSRTSFDRIASHFDTLPTVNEFQEDLLLLKTDLLLIAVPDPEIARIAEWLAGMPLADTVVLHTSGAISSEILASLNIDGCCVGSMHPLISVSDPIAGSNSFERAYFCVEGDPAAVDAASQLVYALSAIPFSIPTENKALYHAGAVIACGHLTALIDISSELMKLAGVPPNDSIRILQPLIKSTVENISNDGTAAALTGSFARADSETVGKHLGALTVSVDKDTVDIYRLLGDRSLALAAERGVDPEKIEQVRKVLFSD